MKTLSSPDSVYDKHFEMTLSRKPDLKDKSMPILWVASKAMHLMKLHFTINGGAYLLYMHAMTLPY